MKIIRNAEDINECALCLGNFDGLHTAHMKIINSCREYARGKNISGGVLLFENHSKTILGNANIKLLTTFDEKLEMLEKTGIDFVFVVDFNKEFMKKTPEEFVELLHNKLKAKALFAGFDYKFGYKASGNIDTLVKLCKQYDIDVFKTEEVQKDNISVSSTIIRELILNAEFEKANLLLGRNYNIMGNVIRGKQNGRKMNFPTANIDYTADKLMPPFGVYSGYTIVDGKRYICMINVGNNPTFNADKITVESNIYDFDEDIYGKRISVEFVEKIRGEFKFSSPDELINQLKKDERYVRSKLKL